MNEITITEAGLAWKVLNFTFLPFLAAQNLSHTQTFKYIVNGVMGDLVAQAICAQWVSFAYFSCFNSLSFNCITHVSLYFPEYAISFSISNNYLILTVKCELIVLYNLPAVALWWVYMCFTLLSLFPHFCDYWIIVYMIFLTYFALFYFCFWVVFWTVMAVLQPSRRLHRGRLFFLPTCRYRAWDPTIPDHSW